MNVSKITIGRLFNLGNYEHIRYEIAVDVKADEAATALAGLERILEALNPKKPIWYLTPAAAASAKKRIQDLREMTDEEVRKRHGQSKYSLLVKWHKQWSEQASKTHRWDIREKHARQMLDDLGGAAKYVDAKENWDLEDNDF